MKADAERVTESDLIDTLRACIEDLTLLAKWLDELKDYEPAAEVRRIRNDIIGAIE